MDFIRAKVAVSVPYEEGRHVPEPSGAVIPVADVAPHMQEQLRAGDPWLENLFESATEDDYELYTGFVSSLEEATEDAPTPDEEPEEVHPLKAQRARKEKTDKEAGAK